VKKMTDETPPVPDGLTPEQIERNAKMMPLLEVVQSAAFEEVAAALETVHSQYVDEPQGYAHIYGVTSMMPRLKDWAERQITS
jgi:hypothetical protein